MTSASGRKTAANPAHPVSCRPSCLLGLHRQAGNPSAATRHNRKQTFCHPPTRRRHPLVKPPRKWGGPKPLSRRACRLEDEVPPGVESAGLLPHQ